VIDFVIGLALLGVWIYCIFEVIASEASVVRNLPKLAWLVIVVLLGPIGALAWIFLGRPRADGTGAPRMSGSSAISGTLRRAGRRDADEDDPAALEARIEARERLMQQWAEEDRRRASGDPPAGLS
jgi:hypothetical protein